MATDDFVMGLAMVKDEADIIEDVLQHMLQQVDQVMVVDNGSTDGTREILSDLPIVVMDDPEVGYYQERRMTALAHHAHMSFGADWVVPFDADEMWFSPMGTIAEYLSNTTASVVKAVIVEYVPTDQDWPEGTPVQRMAYCTESTDYVKVACRPSLSVTIAQGNHSASYPPVYEDDGLVIHHYPYRSVDQFIKKVRNGAKAYAATDLPYSVGHHWREYGKVLNEQGEGALIEIFNSQILVTNPDSRADLGYAPSPSSIS